MTLAAIFRHPVKSVGFERLEEVALEAGKRLPFDRTWAITHGATEYDPANPGWAACANFVRQTFCAELVRVQISLNERGILQASHPLRPPLMSNLNYSGGIRGFLEWVQPLIKDGRPGPYQLVRLEEGAFTDAEEPWISIASVRSVQILEGHLRRPVEAVRFRANLWLDGLDPWEEFDLVGKEITVGETRLRIMEPIERCKAIEANPETGQHDTPVLDLLRHVTGDTNFAVYAEVIEGGTIRPGDAVARV